MKLLDKLKQYLPISRREMDVLYADLAELESAAQEQELMIRKDIRIMFDFIQNSSAPRKEKDNMEKQVTKKFDVMYE